MEDVSSAVRRSLLSRFPEPDKTPAVRSNLLDNNRTSDAGLALGFTSEPPEERPSLPNYSNAPPIRWRKGEIIGCGAFGRVYLGMDLDSGSFLAVKEVLIVTSNAGEEKAQAHIRELEEEVKLLKNLSHPNIVRYLGTAVEGETLNILLEFVSGGSISSLLGKFGSFPDNVVRRYTKQLLHGLEYLHGNGIMHRDIKGANILVDNKGCIKLADFGASKQVAELATVSGAKSMKGTPYWMAPEVILQTGHGFSADIWSVGCTIIEMATGKPPWSQYQEVAALFHIGNTKSHPPIPDHLSPEAKDFLLKCLQKEPNLRPAASDLLQHPFITGECHDSHPISCSSVMNHSQGLLASQKIVCDIGSIGCSIVDADKILRVEPMWGTSTRDDTCQVGERDGIVVDESRPQHSVLMFEDLNESLNPICEPFDDWKYKFDESPEQRQMNLRDSGELVNGADSSETSGRVENDFSFSCGGLGSVEDDEVTEFKIRAFLDEKAQELKKLQSPLYKAFCNTLSTASPPVGVTVDKMSPVRSCRHTSSNGVQNPTFRDSHNTDEWEGVLADSYLEPTSQSPSFSERQRKWKEELDQELDRQREMMRQGGSSRRTLSPRDRGLNNWQKERLRCNQSPSK